MTRTELRRRWLRVLGIMAGTLCVLELLYVLAANAVLASGLVQRAVNATAQAHLDFGDSYTLVPGLVHVENLRLRFEDHNIQFLLKIEEASVQVRLQQLLRKRFSASGVRAEEVSFIFRHKVDQVAGNEAALEMYPTIQGFSDPPLRGEREPSNPDDLWSFALDDVTASVRELWFMTYRFVGEGRVVGGFELVPLRKLQVGPAHLSLRSGKLFLGAERLLSKTMHAEIQAHFVPANPEELPGMAIFRPLSTTVDMSLTPEDIEAANLYLPRDAGLRVAKGRGRLAVHAVLEQGVLQPGTSIDYTSDEEMELRARAVVVRAPIRMTLSVAASEPGVVLSYHADHAELSQNEAGTAGSSAIAVAQRPQLRLRTTHGDLTRPFELAGLRVEVPSLEISELQRLNAFRGADARWLVRSGRANVAALIEQGEDRVRTGFLRTEFQGVGITLDEYRLRATGKARAKLAIAADEAAGTVDEALLELQNASFRSDDDTTEDWWASVLLQHGTFQLAPQPRLEATVLTRAKNVDLILDALDTPDLAHLVIPDKPLEARLEVRKQPGALKLTLLEARTGKLRAHGRIKQSRGAAPSGAFLVQGALVPFGVALESGDVSVRLLASDAWYQQEVAHLAPLN